MFTSQAIADAICSYDEDLESDVAIRYQAHDFVHEALRVIEQRVNGYDHLKCNAWLQRWNKKFGVE